MQVLAMPRTGLMTIAAGLGRLTGWRRLGLSFLLGVFATLALPPVGAWPVLFLSFPGLIWLMIGVEKRKTAFWLGWFFGFGYFVFSLYWISHALTVFSDRLWWMVPFAAMGLPAFLAIYTGLTTLAASFFKKPVSRVFAFVLAWCLFEWLRGVLFTGFPWNLIGYGWAASDVMIQVASLVGIYGVSMLVMVTTAMPALFVVDHRPTRVLALGITILVPVLSLSFGAVRLAEAPALALDAAPDMRIVQAGIPQKEKWAREFQRRNYEIKLRMSVEDRPDSVKTIIWPETAATFYLEENEGARQSIGFLLPRDGLLITGAPRREADPSRPRGYRYYNGVVVLDKQGEVVENYNKSHLVPFGEYVPLKSILPIDKVAHGVADYSAGAGPRSLTLPGLPPVSPLICYEAIFPGAVINPNQPADWMLNLTNDAWYGKTAGPHQHLAIVRVRAVEEGVPMVRAANTGISAVFDSYGRELGRLPLSSAGVLDFHLPDPIAGRTLYSRAGNMLFLGVLAGFWIVILVVRRRQN